MAGIPGDALPGLGNPGPPAESTKAKNNHVIDPSLPSHAIPTQSHCTPWRRGNGVASTQKHCACLAPIIEKIASSGQMNK